MERDRMKRIFSIGFLILFLVMPILSRADDLTLLNEAGRQKVLKTAYDKEIAKLLFNAVDDYTFIRHEAIEDYAVLRVNNWSHPQKIQGLFNKIRDSKKEIQNIKTRAGNQKLPSGVYKRDVLNKLNGIYSRLALLVRQYGAMLKNNTNENGDAAQDSVKAILAGFVVIEKINNPVIKHPVKTVGRDE